MRRDGGVDGLSTVIAGYCGLDRRESHAESTTAKCHGSGRWIKQFQETFAPFHAEDWLIRHLKHRRRQQRRVGRIADDAEVESSDEGSQVPYGSPDDGTSRLNCL